MGIRLIKIISLDLQRYGSFVMHNKMIRGIGINL